MAVDYSRYDGIDVEVDDDPYCRGYWDFARKLGNHRRDEVGMDDRRAYDQGRRDARADILHEYMAQ